MDTKQPLTMAIVIGAIVLVLGFAGFFALRSFGGGGDRGSAPGGAAARTVAPEVQRLPDGTVVPYPAAPAGAIPGDPYSIRR